MEPLLLLIETSQISVCSANDRLSTQMLLASPTEMRPSSQVTASLTLLDPVLGVEPAELPGGVAVDREVFRVALGVLKSGSGNE